MATKLEEKLAERAACRDQVISGRKAMGVIAHQLQELTKRAADIEADTKRAAKRLLGMTSEIESLMHADTAGVVGATAESVEAATNQLSEAS